MSASAGINLFTLRRVIDFCRNTLQPRKRFDINAFGVLLCPFGYIWGIDFYSAVISVGDLLLFRVLWIESDLIHELIMLSLDLELFGICLTFGICIHPRIECGFCLKQSISTLGYRVILFDICEKHGLHLDQEPVYGSRKYLEKQDYIILKQKEILEQKEAELSQVQNQLDEMTLKVEGLETLVDEVAEAAYDKAVEVVTNTVQVETMKADLHQVNEVRAKLGDKTKHYPIKEKNFAEKVLDAVSKRIKNAMSSITQKIIKTLQSPETKKQNLDPIRKEAKKSILAKLKENQEIVKNTQRAENNRRKDIER